MSRGLGKLDQTPLIGTGSVCVCVCVCTEPLGDKIIWNLLGIWMDGWLVLWGTRWCDSIHILG